MTDFHHKVYWWVFWLVFIFVLSPITATYFDRELWVFFIAQPAAAAVIAWIFVVLPAKLFDAYQRKCRAIEEERAAAERRRVAEGDRRRQEAAAQRHAAEQHAASLRALSTRLSNLVSDATQSAAALPALVRSAEQTLDLAEEEFEDGVFAPFWDAVEKAATILATFEATIQCLIQNSQFYKGAAPKLETPPPPFQIGLDTLPDASHTAHRMRAVVRRAQKDFHFATIYEQRKTNQLLVAGFSTLGQAIIELGDRLDSSLDRLASAVSISISDLASDITSSNERMTSEFATALERSREQAASHADAQREHERKERGMLDNMQRRRKPFPPKIGDAEY